MIEGCTMMVFVSHGNVELYHATTHARIALCFLYFKQGEKELLLVGKNDIPDHETLLKLYRKSNEAQLDLTDGTFLKGAGTLFMGQVDWWASQKPAFTTVIADKGVIARLLRAT